MAEPTWEEYLKKVWDRLAIPSDLAVDIFGNVELLTLGEPSIIDAIIQARRVWDAYDASTGIVPENTPSWMVSLLFTAQSGAVEDAVTLDNLLGVYSRLWGRAPTFRDVHDLWSVSADSFFPRRKLSLDASAQARGTWNVVNGRPITDDFEAGPPYTRFANDLRLAGMGEDILEDLTNRKLFAEYESAWKLGEIARATTYEQYLNDRWFRIVDGRDPRVRDLLEIKAKGEKAMQDYALLLTRLPPRTQALARLGLPLDMADLFTPRGEESYRMYTERLQASGALELLTQLWNATPPEGVTVPPEGLTPAAVTAALAQGGALPSAYEFFYPSVPLVPPPVAGEAFVTTNVASVLQDITARQAMAGDLQKKVYDFVQSVPEDERTDTLLFLLNNAQLIQAEFEVQQPSLQAQFEKDVQTQEAEMERFRQGESGFLRARAEDERGRKVTMGVGKETFDVFMPSTVGATERARLLQSLDEQLAAGAITKETYDAALAAPPVSRVQVERERTAVGAAAILGAVTRPAAPFARFVQAFDIPDFLTRRGFTTPRQRRTALETQAAKRTPRLITAG